MRKKPVALFVGLGCGALLFLCLCGVLVFTLFLGRSSSTGRWTFTQDQQRLLREFGPPQAFTLAYASDFATATPGKEPPLVRIETWEYPRLGSAFTFRNGKFTGRAKTAIATEKLRSPALLPDVFVAGMSPSAVSKVIGVKPDKTVNILAKTVPGMTIEVYRGQVAAGFLDGKLVTIETFAVTTKGASK